MRIETLGALCVFVLVAMASPLTAKATFFDCSVMEVGDVDSARVLVKCSNTIVLNGQTIQFVSILNTGEAAKRFVSLATAAMLSGKILRLDIPTTSAGGSGFPANITGCAAADCRSPKSLWLRN